MNRFMLTKSYYLILFCLELGFAQEYMAVGANTLFDSELHYSLYVPDGTERIISRTAYLDQFQGFWLAQCIANWTGLITEMDKIKPPFYTDDNWGDFDQKNIWGNFVHHTNVIDYYFIYKDKPWGADDDTYIEYMYQHLLDIHNVSILSLKC